MRQPRRIGTKVVGVTFVDNYPENVEGIDRLAAARFLRTGELEPIPVVLVRRPDNEFDPNAIEVDVPALGPLGHLPRVVAAVVAPVIDGGGVYAAEITAVLVNPAYPDRPGIDVVLTLVTRAS